MLIFFSKKAINFYQKYSPKSKRNCCRFSPSCSNYAILAIEKHGFILGWKMAIKRINKCEFPNSGEDYP